MILSCAHSCCQAVGHSKLDIVCMTCYINKIFWGGGGGGGGSRPLGHSPWICPLCHVHLPDIFFIQTAGYREDFNEERKDREKAHSKMADMEMQYKQQFNKLGEELMVSRQHCEQLERGLKEVESYYQAQLSQTKYSTGDKNRTISKLQAENKRLEVRVHMAEVKIPSIRLFWPNK